MFKKHARFVAVAGLAGSVAAVAALDASAQERVRWKMQEHLRQQYSRPRPLRGPAYGTRRADVRRQLPDQVPGAGRPRAEPRGLRCGGQGLHRCGVDHPRLPRRQAGQGDLVLHRGPLRPADRRVPRLEVVRRWAGAPRRALQRTWRDRGRLLLHRAGDLGLVQGRDHRSRGAAQGPEDALLRPRRPRDAENGGLHPAPLRRGHLPRSREGGHRRHRVLDADHRHHLRLPPGRDPTTTSPAGTSRSRAASS